MPPESEHRSFPWTPSQQRLYRAQVALLTKHLGFDDALRRDILERVTGCRSTNDIGRDAMRRVIDEQNRLLRQAGLVFPRPGVQASARPRRKFSQEEFIAKLAAQLGWTDQPERLAGFIRKLTRGFKDSVLALTAREKSVLITALRGLLASECSGRAQRERPMPAPDARTRGRGDAGTRLAGRFRVIKGGLASQ